MDVGDEPPAEPRPHPLLEPLHFRRRFVGRDHDLSVLVDQRVESMEELLLRRILATYELNVVNHQQIDRTEPVLEIHRRAEAQRADELVHEFLGRQIDHLAAGGVSPDMPGNRVHQMGFAKADPAIEEKRVERHGMVGRGTSLGDAPGGGMRQFVGLADDEVLEREARIEGAGKLAPLLADLGRRRRFREAEGRRRQLAICLRLARAFPARGGQLGFNDNGNPVHLGVLGAPQSQQAIGIMGGDPVAQKSRLHGQYRLARLDPLDRDVLQPGAVRGFPDFLLELPQNAPPLGRSGRNGRADTVTVSCFPRHCFPLCNAVISTCSCLPMTNQTSTRLRLRGKT